MRPSRFTDEQIQQALRKVRDGVPAAEMCRTLGITHTTFYRWRAKYDTAALTTSREVRALREENTRLREIVADLVLEQQREVPARRRK